VKGVMSSLRESLAADGVDGYLAQFNWAVGRVDVKAALLDYYSGMLGRVGCVFGDSDGV
jgi:hypothetical protein